MCIRDSLMYCSNAIVIEGARDEGASMSNRKPASRTACAVLGPKDAIRVSFCIKSGKFWYNDLIPEGLKNTKTSYLMSLKSDKSLLTVRYKIAFVYLYPSFSSKNGISCLC